MEVKIDTKSFKDSKVWNMWLRPGLKAFGIIATLAATASNLAWMGMGFDQVQGYDHPFVCLGFAIFFIVLFGLEMYNWVGEDE